MEESEWWGPQPTATSWERRPSCREVLEDFDFDVGDSYSEDVIMSMKIAIFIAITVTILSSLLLNVEPIMLVWPPECEKHSNAAEELNKATQEALSECGFRSLGFPVECWLQILNDIDNILIKQNCQPYSGKVQSPKTSKTLETFNIWLIPDNCRWRGWRRQCKFFWPV